MTYTEIARKLRPYIEQAATGLSDVDAAKAPELTAPWAYPVKYSEGDRRSYQGKLYKVAKGKGHTSQVDWTPDVTPSLWVQIDDPTEEWPEWRQPTGAQDAYSNGYKVSHNGKHWTSGYDNNVWEPGIFGWTEAV